MKTMYLKAISKETEKRKASSDECTQHDVNESYLIKQKYMLGQKKDTWMCMT